MKNTDRREFLKLMGMTTLAGALDANIAKAMGISANHRTGTNKDVEHIVILMQENISFDKYFGTLRGVRGFSDPRAVNTATSASKKPQSWCSTHTPATIWSSSSRTLPRAHAGIYARAATRGVSLCRQFSGAPSVAH